MSRYAVTIDLYVYAESAAEAIAKAHEIAGELRYVHDNQAAVLTVHKAPFGKIGPAQIIYPTPVNPKTT